MWEGNRRISSPLQGIVKPSAPCARWRLKVLRTQCFDEEGKFNTRSGLCLTVCIPANLFKHSLILFSLAFSLNFSMFEQMAHHRLTA